MPRVELLADSAADWRNSMNPRVVIASILLWFLLPAAVLAIEVPVFGPTQYVRTVAAPTVYADTFRGAEYPAAIIIRNGDAGGTRRVSSAEILINGVRIVGPNAFNQRIAIIKVPLALSHDNDLVVVLNGAPGGYITVAIVLDVTPDAVSTALIGIEGGSISVENHLGDTLTVDIPPLALAERTSITLSALPIALPFRLTTSLYPGAILEPEGLRFSVPVRITVVLRTQLANPAASALAWRRDLNRVIPLMRSRATATTIEGEMYHFSEIGAYEWTEEDFWAVGEYLGDDEPVQTISDLLGLHEQLEALADKAAEMGFGRVAEWLRNQAEWLVRNHTDPLTNQPLPSQPCGANSVDIQRLADLVAAIYGPHGELLDQVRSRACAFSVSPAALVLSPGATESLTATLLGPSGEQASCSVLNWYSADLDIVAIASSGGDTVQVNAVGPGTVNVSANCDGLLAHSSVSVAGGYAGSISLSGVHSLIWTAGMCGDTFIPASVCTYRIDASGEAELYSYIFSARASGTWIPVIGSCYTPEFDIGGTISNVSYAGNTFSGDAESNGWRWNVSGTVGPGGASGTFSGTARHATTCGEAVVTREISIGGSFVLPPVR
jgi:hypothetical protein